MLKKILLITVLLSSLSAEARIITIWRFDIIWGEPGLEPGIIYNPMKVVNTQEAGEDDKMLEQFLALDKEEQKVILSALMKDKEKALKSPVEYGSTLGILHSSSGSGGPHICKITKETVVEDEESTLGIFHTSSGNAGPHIYCPTLDEFLALEK